MWASKWAFYHTRAEGEGGPGRFASTDDGTNVLVDTGFGAKMVETSHKPDHTGFVVNKEDLVVSQLMRLGVPPSEVKYVIATHFDGASSRSIAGTPITARTRSSTRLRSISTSAGRWFSTR